MVTLSVKFGNRGESEAGGEQLGEPVMVGDIGDFSRIAISFGYTYEDIYFMNTIGVERELTGGEALKVKIDDGVQDIRDVSRDVISNISPENFITILDTQQLLDFQIPLD
jgi:hypothetical protein